MGLAEFDAAEAGPCPAEFVALTENVYAVPFESPVTVQLFPEVVQVKSPGVEVTVYVSIVSPPSESGAVHETTTCALPAEATPIVGAPGMVFGFTEPVADEAFP